MFGFFSLVLVSIYWLNRAVRLFDQLIGDGQTALVFLEFTALALPNVIRLVLPVSAFAATVYVINRMTTESELVVSQAMGVSAFRLARPVLAFGLLVAMLVSLLTHVLVPISRGELTDRRAEISSDVAARLLVEGRFVHPSKGITVFIGEITPLGELQNVLLWDDTTPGQRTTYSARRAVVVMAPAGPKLAMFEGLAQEVQLATGRLATTRFNDSVYDIAGLISQPDTRRRTMHELSTRTLLQASPDVLEETRKSRATFLYEGHARIAQPFIAVAAALVGLAALMLGGFSRFGLWRQIALAIGLLIALQLLDNAVADIVRGNASLWPVVYAPAIIGVVLATGLLWLAQNPAVFARARKAAP